MKKISHEFKCEKCKKPATVNLQKNFQRYSINNQGDFKLEKEWEGDLNEFFCDDCAEKEGII